jgi:hypothetical protein
MIEYIARRPWLTWMLFWFCLAVFMALGVRGSYARDDGHWAERVGKDIAEWMASLMQPDTVKDGAGYSCCGEADAYWADDVHVATGHNGEKFIIARITDTRDDDELAYREHEDVGTEYIIPPNKIVGFEQRLRGNPTGHTIIFLAAPIRFMDRKLKRDVICFVPDEMG